MILREIPTKIIWRKKRYRLKDGRVRIKSYMEYRLVLNKTVPKYDYHKYYVIRDDFLNNLLRVCDKYVELETEYKKLEEKLGNAEYGLISENIRLKSELEVLRDELELLKDMFAEHLSKCLKITKEQAKNLVEHDLGVRLLKSVKSSQESS